MALLCGMLVLWTTSNKSEEEAQQSRGTQTDYSQEVVPEIVYMTFHGECYHLQADCVGLRSRTTHLQTRRICRHCQPCEATN
eukprot:2436797-Amphidinium_carterae.1